jgi:hypothetical protein
MKSDIPFPELTGRDRALANLDKGMQPAPSMSPWEAVSQEEDFRRNMEKLDRLWQQSKIAEQEREFRLQYMNYPSSYRKFDDQYPPPQKEAPSMPTPVNTAGQPVKWKRHTKGDFILKVGKIEHICPACIQLLSLDDKMDLREVLDAISYNHRRPRLKEIEKLHRIRRSALALREERPPSKVAQRMKQLEKLGIRESGLRFIDHPEVNTDFD